MKKYTTYTRKKVNDNYYADPNTNNAVSEQSNGLIQFNETPYEINGVFISWIEYDESIVNPETLEYFRTLDPAMNFTIKTEEEVNELLSELGKVSVKNFVFTDNRPTITIGLDK